MPVLPGDSRADWDRDVLDDPRVTQQLFGRWVRAHGGAFWDTFLVYGPQTHWSSEPEGALESGSPIIGATNELKKGLLPLIGEG